MLRTIRVTISVQLALTIVLSSEAQNINTEQEALAEHAASCAAYFYSAAYANGVSKYESFYGAGEYSFNLAVTASSDGKALEWFNDASKQINQLMGKRWVDFHKAEAVFGPKCEKLMSASQ